ncbi:MAG TPA: type II secretion system F family protein [Caldilineaceae bacterium]|nr:type II secretion system F family protein [Caldilineaceae bacterium]
MSWVLIVALLVSTAIYAAMIGFYRWLSWTRDVEQRMAESMAPVAAENHKRTALADQVNRRLSRMSFAERIERQLIAADSNLSVGEFLLFRAGITLGAFFLGWLISGMAVSGIALAMAGWAAVGVDLRRRQAKRAKAFANQLPDMLTMLIGSLRAGYGLLYAVAVVEKEMPEPIASEFGRVVKETALGYSIGEALDRLVERMQNDDLALVVTAIHIQNEVGGSLADVLEIISKTIRERIQLQGQIRAITSQQRMTGSLLTGLPFLVGLALMILNPEYLMGIFQPGWILAIPIGATMMVILGNIVMRKVTTIDV